MDRKIVLILILTVAAICYLAIYTFGPQSITHSGQQINPESLKPSPTMVGQNNVTLQTFHNKDSAENFYAVSIPKSWILQTSASPGEYDFVFNGGTAKTELMDVPDNSTLELFVLSQQEPMLKNSISGYKRISYQKLNVSGNAAYQLAYLSSVKGVDSETIKTYIAGPDKAAVITFSLPQTMATKMQNEFGLVIDRFSWEAVA